MKPLKLKHISKKSWTLICSSSLLLFAMFSIFAVGTDMGRAVVSSASKRDLPIYCVDTQEKKLAISFDAAWGNEDTNELIKIMDNYKIKATFFVVGDWVRKYPESVKALSEAGHDVMSHSDKHKHMTKLSREEIVSDINTCADAIEGITGVRPTLFRPPYGEYDNKVVSTLRELNHYTIQWDVDSLDWKQLSENEIASRVLSKVKNGSIVLFHNAALNTPKALPEIIEKLQGEGYEFVKISQLIYKDNYTIDHTGKQIKNN